MQLDRGKKYYYNGIMKKMILVFFAISSVAFGELKWSEPMLLWSDIIYVGNPNIIQTTDGRILAAWGKYYGYYGDSAKIFLRYYDGDQWSALIEDRIFPPASFGSPFPLAIDADGYIWTMGKIDTSVYAFFWDGDKWSEPEWIWDAPRYSYTPRLIHDNNGRIWAVLNHWSGDYDVYFYVTFRDNDQWSYPGYWAQTEWCMGGGDFRIGCDRSNQIWLVWGGLELGVVCEGSGPEILIPDVHTCQPVRITFDSQNRAWLFYQFEFDSLTSSRHRVNSQWSPFDTVFFPSHCYDLSCCCDSNGVVWVASSQDTTNLTHIILRSCDPTTERWSEIIAYDPLSNWREYNPVLLACKGRLWMVWNADSADTRGVFASYADLPGGITESPLISEGFSLRVMPNPFRNKTNIRFSLPKKNYVRLNIYDAVGRLCTPLWNGWLESGEYNFNWDRQAEISGIYFCLFQVGGLTIGEKIIAVQ